MKKLNKEVLAHYYVEKDLSQREIAEKFDLSQPCISKKMKKFGIDSDHTGFWSEEEEALMMKKGVIDGDGYLALPEGFIEKYGEEFRMVEHENFVELKSIQIED